MTSDIINIIYGDAKTTGRIFWNCCERHFPADLVYLLFYLKIAKLSILGNFSTLEYPKERATKVFIPTIFDDRRMKMGHINHENEFLGKFPKMLANFGPKLAKSGSLTDGHIHRLA